MSVFGDFNIQNHIISIISDTLSYSFLLVKRVMINCTRKLNK